ncbi:MAG: hypothetical protein FJ387_01610 [Verrucomicrobia bacterium]|nr:hypothetical protein [Verrucomicrobiota bacterium]
MVTAAIAPGAQPRVVGARRHPWGRRALLAAGSTVALLGLLCAAELALRWAGSGYPTAFFLRREDPDQWTDNRRYAWRFFPRGKATEPYPFALPLQKPDNTLRLFVLGDSAALGTPAPAFGFSRILGLLLEHQYPECRFEIVNAAMWGINSHVALPIARECAQREPDLFLVYLGNNEAIGLHSPQASGLQPPPWLDFLRWSDRLKSAKLAQWLAATRAAKPVSPIAPGEQSPEFFRRQYMAADHPRRARVYAHFRENLLDIARAARSARIPVLLATVAVNLRDFPPLASLHRPNLDPADQARWETAYARGVTAQDQGQLALAIDHFQQAAQLDDHYAELHFRLARCHADLGHTNAAAEQFRLARDWDALAMRAHRRINALIREVATAPDPGNVRLVEVERAFAESPLSDHGVPGAGLFHEHVHFTFAGDYLLACTFLPAVAEALALGPPRPAPNGVPWLSRAECARRLAFTAWDELGTRAAMLRLTARPPFTSQLDHAQRQAQAEAALTNRLQSLGPQDFEKVQLAYREAIAQRPADWSLCFNYGGFFDEIGDFNAAAAQFEQAVRLLPHAARLRMALGNTLMNAHRYAEAWREFEALRQREPDHELAPQMAQQAQLRLGSSSQRDANP